MSRHIVVDESIDSSEYLSIKNDFIKKYFHPVKAQLLLDRLTDAQHKQFVGHALSFGRRLDAIQRGVPSRRLSIDELRKNLGKLYNRYYNVYVSGKMPPGVVRDPHDPDTNFKNRMKLVLADFDIIIPALDGA